MEWQPRTGKRKRGDREEDGEMSAGFMYRSNMDKNRKK